MPTTPPLKGSPGENPYSSIPPSASVSSLGTTPQPSPRVGSRASFVSGGKAAPVGKALSSVDTKNVFLNLDQLATAADELATALEGALGEDDNGPGAVPREGEGGSDRLGDVFSSLVSKP